MRKTFFQSYWLVCHHSWGVYKQIAPKIVATDYFPFSRKQLAIYVGLHGDALVLFRLSFTAISLLQVYCGFRCCFAVLWSPTKLYVDLYL